MLWLLDKSVLQLSVTALFYLEDSRKINLQGVRAHRFKDTRRAPQCAGERERESWLWFFYLYVYLSLGLSYVNWATQECCLFYLRSSFWSSDLLLFYFWGFSFPCLLATTILDSFSLFYLPNIPPSRDGRPNSLGIGASRSFWLLPAELGRQGVLDLPLLLVSSLRVLIAVSI